MAYTISMDKAGRLVLPKVLRERYGLGVGAHELELVDTTDGILMRPKAEFLNLKRTSSGWMVFEAPTQAGAKPGDSVAEIELDRERRRRHIAGEE